MAGGGVKLYGMWASPAVRRVEWALKTKGIKYEYIEEDLCNKSPALLKYNPINKQVPVLLHEGKPIIESVVILEYIDEVWKQEPLLPKEPYERAKARFWAAFSDDKCREAVRGVFFAMEESDKLKALEHLEEILAMIDEELKGRRFFGGKAMGFVDLVMGWMAFWLGVAEDAADFKVLDPKRFPWLCSWIETFILDPVIRESLPPREKAVEFFGDFRRLRVLPSCK